MGISPGVLGGRVSSNLINKVKDCTYNIPIVIDGGVTFESIPLLSESGASHLVTGSSTLLKAYNYKNNYSKLLALKESNE